MPWDGVRHVLKRGASYEERVTLWAADTFADAIAEAENEAARYATEILGDGEVLDLFQAYLLPEHEHESAADTLLEEHGVAVPRRVFLGEPGSELFSLIRDSDLSPDEYVNRYFDTGTERQGTWRAD